MNITAFNFSEEHYCEVVQLYNAYYPMFPTHTKELQAEDENNRAKELKRFIYRVEGRTLGFGQLQNTLWTDDLHNYSMEIVTAAAEQGQGYGDFMYRHLSSLKTHHPIHFLEAGTSTLIETGPHFLEKRGFTLATCEHVSALDFEEWTPDPFTSRLDGIQSKGIQFVSYQDLAERGYSDRELHHLLSTIDLDIPWHMPHQPETFDQWNHRRTYDDRVQTRCSLVALSPLGELLGATELESRPNAPNYLYQGLTGVLPAYRRQGIAFGMKCSSFIQVQQLLPGIKKIWTENEKNNPMFRLNQKLGFKREFDWLFYQKK